MADNLFTVGEAAEKLGCHPGTLRNYDRFDIFKPERTAGGIRLYSIGLIAKIRYYREQRASRWSKSQEVKTGG